MDVIEGELLLHIDGVEHTAGAGANAEAFFREGGEPAPSRTPPPPDSLDIPRLIEAGKRTGAMDVLGPPPFALDEATSRAH